MQGFEYQRSYSAWLQERQGQTSSETEVQEILRQILPQLAQTHQQGYVYGYICPDNLIQNLPGLEVTLQQNVPVQPLSYRAPECLQAGQPSVAGDIYSLGVTVISLLTGQPNLDIGYFDWQSQIFISDQLIAVLQRMTAADPYLRYSNVPEVMQDLGFVILPQGVPGQPSSPTATFLTNVTTQPLISATNPPATNGLKWGLIGAGLTVAAGLGAWGVLQFLSPRSTQQPMAVAPNSMPTGIAESGSTPPTLGQPTSASPPPPLPSASAPPLASSTPTSYEPREEPRILPAEQSTPSVPPTVQTERISFASGATGAFVTSRVTTNQVKRYLLNCGEGQQFTVRVVQGRVNVTVIAPNGDTIGRTTLNGTPTWKGNLPATGDYAVEVSAPEGASYEVYVEVI